MKKSKISKKLFALVLCVLTVFSSVSVAAVESEPEITSDHEHFFGNYVVVAGKEPTCSKTGLAVSDCLIDGCTEVSERVLPVESNRHTLGNVVETKEATCIFDGYEIRKCIECDKKYEIIIEKTGHTFDEENWVITQEPVHRYTGSIPELKDGVKINTCLTCGYNETEYFMAPHIFAENDTGELETSATCVTPGAVFKSCTLCKSAVSVEIPVDPTAHQFNDTPHIINDDFSCQQDGTGVVVCELCETVAIKNIPASTAHEYLEWKVIQPLPADATCDNGKYGVRKKVCPNPDCDYNGEEKKIYAPHDLTNIKGIVPTCIEDGYDIGYCRVCRKSNRENIIPVDSNNHSWMSAVVLKPATCKEPGLTMRRCSLKASHVEVTEIEKLAHVYGTEWTINKEATCIEDGYKTNTCLTCNELITEVLPKSFEGHKFDESQIKDKEAASCYSTGSIKVLCTICNNYISRILPLHSENRIINAREEATCSKDGYLTYECRDCSKWFTEILPANDGAHEPDETYEKVILNPTCCSTGIKVRACIICLEDIESTKLTIPATGAHTVSKWETADGECESISQKIRYCTNVGRDGNACTFTETMNTKISHNYTAWEYTDDDEKFTCVNPVTRKRSCLSCDHNETQSYYSDHTIGRYAFQTGNCKLGGTVNIYCADCENIYDFYTVSKDEHVIELDNPIENIAANDAVCAGKTYECKVCKMEDPDNKGVMVPTKVNVTKVHRFRTIIEYVAPTCESAGNTAEKTCIDCRYHIKSQPLSMLEHKFDWGDGGSKICINCGTYETDIEKGEDEFVTCGHFCHNKGTITKILVKFLSFFWKLFGSSHFCADCGTPHYHQEETEIISRIFNKDGSITLVYSCEACEVTNEEIVLK